MLYHTKEKKSYLIPTSSTKTTRKLEDLPKYSYLRRSYFETEPNNNIRHYNQKTVITESINQPLLSSISVINKEEKPAITSVQTIDPDFNNIINNIRKRIYKTSTNTNFEEKNKNNYYKSIIERSSYDSKRRNNTPNISTRYDSRDNRHNNFQYNITERNPEKKSIPNTYNRNEIPYDKYRYNNTDIVDNILNNTQRNYQPKYTLNQRNLNSNNDTNKNRYNFQEKPKLREYGTKTEVHSYNKYNYGGTF